MESRMKYLVFMMLLIPSLVGGEIYKWTDSHGRVHFGDLPKKEAKAEKITVDVVSYKSVKIENVEFYQAPKRTRQSDKVIMYSTSWCGYCKKAKKYFNQNNIAFNEYDIEKNKAANQQFKKLGGRGVPLILVGNKKMSGFSEQGFERIYP